MFRKRIYLIIATITWLSWSCQEELEPKPHTFTQLLTGETSKTWEISEVFLLQQDFDPVRYPLPTCLLDDSYTFYNNQQRTYEARQNQIRCFSGDEDVFIVDSWSFINATATLDFFFPGLFGLPIEFTNTSFRVTSISDDKLIMEYDFEDLTFRFILNTT